MFFDEAAAEDYDWNRDGIYILQEYDPVQGGEEGTSNVQAKALALRTRYLFNRMKEQEDRIAALEAAVISLTKNTP